MSDLGEIRTIADHLVAVGTRVRKVDPAHLESITARCPVTRDAAPVRLAPALQRPLAEYAQAVGELACRAAA